MRTLTRHHKADILVGIESGIGNKRFCHQYATAHGNLLREPKRLEVFDCGHIPPAEISAPIINSWLDKTLGPVKHE